MPWDVKGQNRMKCTEGKKSGIPGRGSLYTKQLTISNFNNNKKSTFHFSTIVARISK